MGRGEACVMKVGSGKGRGLCDESGLWEGEGPV